MMVRCFIALDLPREAINYVKDIQKLIGKQNLFTGKFTEPENLHLTLKFLGEISEEQVEEVKERLKKIKFSVFEAELGEVGTFSKKFIRIIWMKLKNCGKLQKQVDEALGDLFEPEFRFMGHITIARVKRVGDRKGLIDYVKHMKTKIIKFKVGCFFLKKSELAPEGPVYEDLEEYKLVEKK